MMFKEESSDQSILAVMTRFVQTVNAMDETVLIPMRLKDLPVKGLQEPPKVRARCYLREGGRTGPAENGRSVLWLKKRKIAEVSLASRKLLPLSSLSHNCMIRTTFMGINMFARVCLLSRQQIVDSRARRVSITSGGCESDPQVLVWICHTFANSLSRVWAFAHGNKENNQGNRSTRNPIERPLYIPRSLIIETRPADSFHNHW